MKEHAAPGDVIIDFDEMAQALGSPNTHGHSEAIGRVAAAARRAAIKEAVRQHDIGYTVWIIQCEPPGPSYGGAEVVALVAEREELHRRAKVSGRPDSWIDLINSHLDAYGGLITRDW